MAYTYNSIPLTSYGGFCFLMLCNYSTYFGETNGLKIDIEGLFFLYSQPFNFLPLDRKFDRCKSKPLSDDKLNTEYSKSNDEKIKFVNDNVEKKCGQWIDIGYQHLVFIYPHCFKKLPSQIQLNSRL